MQITSTEIDKYNVHNVHLINAVEEIWQVAMILQLSLNLCCIKNLLGVYHNYTRPVHCDCSCQLQG